MFNTIKSLIVLFLIVGVIILGVRIHQKSSDLGKEADTKQNELQDKISDIKKNVLSKTEDLGKVYEHVNEELDEALGLKQTEINNDNAKDEDTKIIIDPLDEEDRALTEEVLKKGTEESDQSELAWELNEDLSEVSSEELFSQAFLLEEEKFTSMDLNKAAEIRELYLEAIETLDFK